METKAQEYARKAAHQRECAEEAQALLDVGPTHLSPRFVECLKEYHLDLALRWERKARLANRND